MVISQSPPSRIALQRLHIIQATTGTTPRSQMATLVPGAAPSRAPWRDLLTSHLNKTPSYDFTIATVAHDAQNRPVPRVRTCGCRGFFPELELHPNGQEDMWQQVDEGENPAVVESDMLAFTTDVRMEKLSQLESSGRAIEAVFWFKDLMAQWRVKGRAFAIGDPRGEQAERVARSEIQKGLRVKHGDDHGDDGSGLGKWSWDKAVTKYFANHSPVMRGSFRSPPPGQPRSQVPSDSALGLGQKVKDLHDPVARANFRVVVIQPEEVERLDLTDYENPRRWKWTLVSQPVGDGQGDQWAETELWP